MRSTTLSRCCSSSKAIEDRAGIRWRAKFQPMDAIAAIHRRTSIRRFRPDPVPRDIIEALLECAVRAPNHKLTQPWRFTLLAGRARDRFAELRAGHRLKRFDNPAAPEALAAADKVRRETGDTPVFIV